MAFFRTPCYERLDWPTTRAAVLEAEALGYDSLFVADHLFLGRGGAIYEGWTLLAALAGMTRRVELAPIHLCDSFRNPALLAKQVATLDVISGGRVILFYDYGWRRAEFEAYGFAFERSDDVRAAKMAEGLEIVLALLERGRASHAGRFYRVRDAVCEPRPLQRPRPPLWLGEAHNPVMVETIARRADVWNSMPVSLEGFAEKWRSVEAACARVGRDAATLGRSLETQVLIAESDAAVDAVLERIERLRPAAPSDVDILEQMKATNPALEGYGSRASLECEFAIGTPDAVAERLRAFVELGVSHFMLWFMDFPDLSGLRLFAHEVAPRLRA
jgi:alkanesulfonate monooxygenase SsuD/methylene tetrahydromethanopterin reductase-like flavin-dependent oxidoreductase (luciferase family)